MVRTAAAGIRDGDKQNLLELLSLKQSHIFKRFTTGAAQIKATIHKDCVSAGKSSKKIGGRSSSSTSNSEANKSKAGSSSTKLPPIPYQETPSWQKPITNFFKKDSPLKAKDNKPEENKEFENKDKCNEYASEAGPSKKKLRFDSENISSDHEESTEVNKKTEENKEKDNSDNKNKDTDNENGKDREESTEIQESEEKETSEANKENSSTSTVK